MLNEDLIDEVGEWARENFGIEQPPEFPLIGAGEEAGELTRSVLKRAQGIDDSDKYADRDGIGDDAERDAIGDVAIYMCDTITRLHSPDTSDSYPEEIDELLGFFASFGVACHAAKRGWPDEEFVDALMNALEHLDNLAEIRGFDFDECVEEAWEEVSDREWDADVSV